MVISRQTYFAEIAVAVVIMLTSFIDGAPTGTVPNEDTISDSYRILYQRTVAFNSAHLDIFNEFKSVRLNNEDTMNDVHSFTFEGLPTAVSPTLAFHMEERDLLVLHRDNFQAFESFVEVMYVEELDHEAEGLPNPFHEEFQEIRHHLELVITQLNSLLHSLGHADSVDTNRDTFGNQMLNSAHIRDIRQVKVLHELSEYLPGARHHFEYLGKNVTA